MKAEVLNALVYNPREGLFVRRSKWEKISQRGRGWDFVKSRPWLLAGGVTPLGYRLISINNTSYYAHRLVWLIETGDWPTEVDHINGEKDDNRFENLRECTHSENMEYYYERKRA